MDLPSDVWGRIVTYLGCARDVLSVCLACRHFWDTKCAWVRTHQKLCITSDVRGGICLAPWLVEGCDKLHFVVPASDVLRDLLPVEVVLRYTLKNERHGMSFGHHCQVHSTMNAFCTKAKRTLNHYFDTVHFVSFLLCRGTLPWHHLCEIRVDQLFLQRTLRASMDGSRMARIVGGPSTRALDANLHDLEGACVPRYHECFPFLHRFLKAMASYMLPSLVVLESGMCACDDTCRLETLNLLVAILCKRSCPQLTSLHLSPLLGRPRTLGDHTSRSFDLSSWVPVILNCLAQYPCKLVSLPFLLYEHGVRTGTQSARRVMELDEERFPRELTLDLKPEGVLHHHNPAADARLLAKLHRQPNLCRLFLVAQAGQDGLLHCIEHLLRSPSLRELELLLKPPLQTQGMGEALMECIRQNLDAGTCLLRLALPLDMSSVFDTLSRHDGSRLVRYVTY